MSGDGHLAYLADDYQVISAALGHLRVALNLRGGGDGLVASTRGQLRAAEVKVGNSGHLTILGPIMTDDRLKFKLIYTTFN